MGVIAKSALFFSSTTFIGYLGLRHLRNVIKEVPLPASSTLQQHYQQAKDSSPNDGHFADAFQAQLPSNVVEHIHHNKNKEVNVDACVRAFYSSWIFKVEKTIMKVVFRKPEPDLSSFDVGKSIYVWKVESRNNEEILLVWETGPVKGSTWFCLSQQENVIRFGSTVQTQKAAENRIHESEDKSSSVSIDGKPYNSLEGKFLKSAKDMGWSLIWTFHRAYSMIILNSILRKITKDVKH